MFATVIRFKITFSLKIALAENCGRLQKEMSNQLRKTAEDRRRPQKSAEDRRISKSSQKIAAEISIERKFAEDRRRRRRPQKIAEDLRKSQSIAKISQKDLAKIAEDSERPQKNERKTN